VSSQKTLTLYRPNLPKLELIASGKVREVYRVDPATLLFLATDRISAFDCILPDPIPRKGEVLTQMSVFWFDWLRDLTSTHFRSADVQEYPVQLREYEDQLIGRSMLVRQAEMIAVECVARGYLAGSGWKEYRESGTICGIVLPAGLKNGDQLPEPLFTPATKAHSGHDENVSFEVVADRIGAELAATLRDRTLSIYTKTAAYAREKGIILADTKFEFGFINGELTLCDEVLTPDSSRFWPLDTWHPGGPQVSYDKQFVRDFLESISLDKQPPAPHLPANIIEKTSVKYVEAYHVLTERTL
jgi:phosphoribosylaminoimidazole-succinocarboxamide synthase